MVVDGLSSSVFPGTDLGGRYAPRSRYPNFGQPQNRTMFLAPNGELTPRNLNPVAVPAPRYNPTAPLTVTATPKSPQQSSLLQGVLQTAAGVAPTKKQSLTDFVREQYKLQEPTRAALGQETAAIDKIFAKDGGLVDELANSRAKRRAGVMMRVKMAMDAARRQNNMARMMRGNNSYLDRAYNQNTARIAADTAIQDSDLERDDIRYVTGAQMGATGRRGALNEQYLNSVIAPYRQMNSLVRDDLGVLGEAADLQDRNTIYETPMDQMRRELAMRDGLSELEWRY